jgi:hypothetical protein
MLGASVETDGPYIQGSNPTLADINLMPYVARLDYLRLLDLWIKDRPSEDLVGNARRWPSFKSGLLDRISETERSEMRVHGTKIVNDVGDAISELIATT